GCGTHSPQPVVGVARQGACCMSDEVVGLACRNAYACISKIESLKGLADLDLRFHHPLPDLISFWIEFSPLHERRLASIWLAAPLLRGLHPPRGVRLARRTAGCAHEVVAEVMDDLQQWLRDHEVFHGPALILENKCLGLFEKAWWEWRAAVGRFVRARLAPEKFRPLASSERWNDPKWEGANAIYRSLMEDPQFHG